MADEEKTETSEAGEAAGGKKKLIIIAAAAVVLVLGGAGAGFVFLGGSQEPPGEEDPAQAEQAEEAPESEHGATDSHAEKDTHVASATEKGTPAGAPTFVLDSFIVNITDRDRDRYLKLKLELELADTGVSSEVEQRLPHIRDIVISLLGSKSFEDVRSMEGKDLLREEILQRVNALLTTGKARRVFFTEFVVQ